MLVLELFIVRACHKCSMNNERIAKRIIVRFLLFLNFIIKTLHKNSAEKTISILFKQRTKKELLNHPLSGIYAKPETYPGRMKI